MVEGVLEGIVGEVCAPLRAEGRGRELGDVRRAGEEVALGLVEVASAGDALLLPVGGHVGEALVGRGVVERVRGPCVGVVVHVGGEHAAPHETGIPCAGLAVFEQEVFALVLGIAQPVAADVALGGIGKGFQRVAHGGVGGGVEVGDLLPAEHKAFVGVVAEWAIAVIAVLPVVHDAPEVHGEEAAGDVVVAAGVVEVGESEGVAELVTEDADAVGVGVLDLRRSAIGIVVALEQLIADKAAVDGDALYLEVGHGLEVGPDVFVRPRLLGAMGTGPGIVDGDEGDGARLVLELIETDALLDGSVEGFAQEALRGGDGAASGTVAVGLIAKHGLDDGHDLEGGTIEAVALGFEIVLHAAVAVLLVVVAGLVEEARDFVDGGRVLEGAVGEADHDDGDDGGSLAAADTGRALAVGAGAIGVGGGTGTAVEGCQAHGAAGCLHRQLCVESADECLLLQCANIGIMRHEIGGHKRLAVGKERGVAQVALAVGEQREAVAGEIVVEESVALKGDAHEGAIALLAVEGASDGASSCSRKHTEDKEENGGVAFVHTGDMFLLYGYW